MSVPIGLPDQFGTILRSNLGRETGVISRGAPEGVAPGVGSGPSFADRLREFANGVNAENVKSESMVAEFAAGRNEDVHGTMIAMQKADISLRLLATVKNRVMEAYREVMRMGG